MLPEKEEINVLGLAHHKYIDYNTPGHPVHSGDE
jgi:hypothetical protein